MENSHERPYRGKNVLVLGATGFIGRWVARALSQQGATLHLAVRNRERSREILDPFAIDGDVVEIDLCDDDALATLIESVRPSITFNLAGYGVQRDQREDAKAYAINDRLLEVLTDALSRCRDLASEGRTLIHVGSALEYGEASGDLVETTRALPTTLYGRSKLAGTQRLSEASRRHGLDTVTARLFTVYGPGEHAGRLLPALLDASHSKESVPLTAGDQLRDFTYVEDVAEGLLRLALTTGEPGQIVNLATGRLTSVRRFIETAADVLGVSPARLEFGALPTRTEEMSHEPVSIGLLRQTVHWKPTTGIKEGIRRTRDFYMT